MAAVGLDLIVFLPRQLAVGVAAAAHDVFVHERGKLVVDEEVDEVLVEVAFVGVLRDGAFKEFFVIFVCEGAAALYEFVQVFAVFEAVLKRYLNLAATDIFLAEDAPVEFLTVGKKGVGKNDIYQEFRMFAVVGGKPRHGGQIM